MHELFEHSQFSLFLPGCAFDVIGGAGSWPGRLPTVATTSATKEVRLQAMLLPRPPSTLRCSCRCGGEEGGCMWRGKTTIRNDQKSRRRGGTSPRRIATHSRLALSFYPCCTHPMRHSDGLTDGWKKREKERNGDTADAHQLGKNLMFLGPPTGSTGDGHLACQYHRPETQKRRSSIPIATTLFPETTTRGPLPPPPPHTHTPRGFLSN